MERISHKKPKMPKIDPSKPLDINIIGSADDPCFGKHHSLTASQCRVCGDSEICSIITGQVVNSSKRAQAHREHKFKDLEEAELLTKQNEEIRKTLFFRTKGKPKGAELKAVVKKVSEKLDMEFGSCSLLVKSYLAKNKDKYTYNKETKIIKAI